MLPLLDPEHHYWCVLEPHCYRSMCGNKCVAFNTTEGGAVFASLSDMTAKQISPLFDLFEPTPLLLSGEVAERDDALGRIVTALRRVHVADLLPAGSTVEPIFFSLEPRIEMPKQCDLDSLSEIRIQLTSACDIGCELCSLAHSQYSCCYRAGREESMDPTTFSAILNQLRSSVKLTLFGGDVLSHGNLEEILSCVARTERAETYILVHPKSVLRNFAVLNNAQHIGATIVVTMLPDCDTLVLQEAIAKLRALPFQVNVRFFVRNDTEHASAWAFIDKNLQQEGFSVVPLFTGGNLRFFSNRVFVNVRALLERPWPLSTILSNALINRLFFGRLEVDASGNVSSLGGSKLGNVHSILLSEATIAAISNRGTWLQTRRSVRPCADCVLRDICPPVSQYDAAINRHDLCDVSKWSGRGLYLVPPSLG